MGRGSFANRGGGGGGIGTMALRGVQTAGEISYQDMMAISASNLSQATISFDKVATVLPENGAPYTIKKKSDITDTIKNSGLKRVVVNMYRDQAGKNDLQRMFDAGFQIQAEFKAPDTGSAIPPRDYYFLIKP